MDDIRRQVVIALRWLPLVIMGAVLAGGLAYAWSSGQPRAYEATARLIVDPGPNPTTQDLEVAQEQAVRYAELADSRSNAVAVIDKLGLDESPEGLLARTSTRANPDSLDLAISVRDSDPAGARLLAETIGDDLRARVRDRLITDEVREADRAIKANQAAIDFSQRRLNTLIAKPNKTPRDRLDVQALFSQISQLQSDILLLQQSSSAFVRNRLNWFEEPNVPTSPVEPRPMYWTLLALVVGGMMGLGIGFVIEFLNGKIRDERDLEAATGIGVIGSISEKRGSIRLGDAQRLVMLRHLESEEAESYRSLRARISLVGGAVRTLLVAGADDSEAKSVVAANLALACAEAGRTVILVDADLRSARLHSFFGLPNERGLSVLLTGNDVPLGFVTLPTPHPRLRLMPAGPTPTEGSGALGSPQVPQVLGRLLQAADMVVFDAPSLAINLDAAMLATHLQASILVVPAGSRGGAAAVAARALEPGDGHLAGLVLYRTVRGSDRRTLTRFPITVPARSAAIPSRSTSQPPSLPQSVQPTAAPASAPPATTTLETIPPRNPSTPTFLLAAFLYKIVRGPHAHPVMSPETHSVNGHATEGPAVSAGVTADVIKTQARASNGQQAPAEPWPEHPRPPIAVPVDPPLGASTPPYIGPFSGGFKPGPNA